MAEYIDQGLNTEYKWVFVSFNSKVQTFLGE